MSIAKKIISIFVCMTVAVSFLAFPASCKEKTAAAKKEESKTEKSEKQNEPANVTAKGAILMDMATGKILYEKGSHERLNPASVTKIMSLLLVMEAIDSGKIGLTDKVTASDEACKKGGSQIWLKQGEQMTVDELLRATAIQSANDACVALGDYIAGSEEAFVVMMNQKAKQLGMNDTNFENATGLDDTATNHLTSAHDIAVMSKELMIKHSLIKKYSTVWMDSLRGGKTELTNTNKLVRFYEGITGLKTGTTSKSGYCLSATAERNGTKLVAVVLGCPTSDERFASARSMLNWGFANWACVTPKIDKSMITNVSVLHGKEKSLKPVSDQIQPVLIKKGREKDIGTKIDLPINVEAPVEKGQVLGKITLTLDGVTLAEYNLTSGQKIDKMTFFFALKTLLKSIA